MTDCFFGDAFGVCHVHFGVLFCRVLWSAADTQLNLLDPVVSGVFQCDIVHRRSVAVLCMLYMIRCNLKPHHYGALPLSYVIVRLTRGAVVAHRYTYAPPRYRTSQYRNASIPISVSLWIYLADSYSTVFD